MSPCPQELSCSSTLWCLSTRMADVFGITTPSFHTCSFSFSYQRQRNLNLAASSVHQVTKLTTFCSHSKTSLPCQAFKFCEIWLQSPFPVLTHIPLPRDLWVPFVITHPVQYSIQSQILSFQSLFLPGMPFASTFPKVIHLSRLF